MAYQAKVLWVWKQRGSYRLSLVAPKWSHKLNEWKWTLHQSQITVEQWRALDIRSIRSGHLLELRDGKPYKIHWMEWPTQKGG